MKRPQDACCALMRHVPEFVRTATPPVPSVPSASPTRRWQADGLPSVRMTSWKLLKKPASTTISPSVSRSWPVPYAVTLSQQPTRSPRLPSTSAASPARIPSSLPRRPYAPTTRWWRVPSKWVGQVCSTRPFACRTSRRCRPASMPYMIMAATAISTPSATWSS